MKRRAVTGRALVVGCPGNNLRGVEYDVRTMAAMLGERGFAVDVRTGRRATRAGILAGYDELIAGARADEPAVFYYSGHGFYAVPETERSSWQGIAPTDLDAGTTDDFRGITAWELSINQAKLTQRTRNVTVILDCCYASQMSRDAAAHRAVARALPHPVRLGFANHLRALRRKYGRKLEPAAAIGNRDAVRLVACGQDESALEYQPPNGEHRGVYTEALLDVLREVNGTPVSWAAIEASIRSRVIRKFAIQRPGIEGPSRRRLFSLDEDDGSEAVTITATRSEIRIGAGHLFGVAAGDVLGVMPSGSRTFCARDAIAEVEVNEPSATFAGVAVKRWINGHSVIPRGAVAFPITRTAARYAVVVDVPKAVRADVAAKIAATRTLRVADPADMTALARLRLRDGTLTIEDRVGPLFPRTRYPADLDSTVSNLANLGAAQTVRELEGEHGVSGHEVEIEWGAIDRGQMRRMPERGGSLALRDRFYVRVRSKAKRALYVHVFNVGLRGKLSLLTEAHIGVGLSAKQPEFVLGKRPGGPLQGIPLYWPDGLPRASFPRLDELVVIVTAMKTNLRGLETVEHLPGARGSGPTLDSLLARLGHGSARSGAGGAPYDGFLVKRLSYLLHPQDAVMADTRFEIDDNPLRQTAARAADAWFVVRGRAATAPAETISIRVDDLVIEDHRTLWPDLRFDALLCTRARGTAGHVTWTERLREVADGPRNLANPVVFHGPVRDFIDLFLWVSRDARGSRDLAQLLAQRTTGRALRDAVRPLSIDRAPPGVPWVAAAGASAIAARIAHDTLIDAVGASRALYRTAFCADQRYGTGRHPRAGHGVAWSLVVTHNGRKAP